MYPIKRQFL